MKRRTFVLPWANLFAALSFATLPINWRDARRRRLYLGALASSAAVCILAVLWMHSEQGRAAAAAANRQAAEAALAQARAAFAVQQSELPASRRDLASLDATALLGHLKHFSEDTGLGVPEVTFSEPTRVDAALMRVDIFVSLKGRYPEIKNLLGETVDRYPALRLVSLEITQATSAAVAEAKVQAAWFSEATPAEAPHVAQPQ